MSSPGVILKVSFIRPDGQRDSGRDAAQKKDGKGRKTFKPQKEKTTFAGYIDYIDRDKAKKENDYRLYQDYMGNPEKSGGMFTESSDCLDAEGRARIKKLFAQAQAAGSLMWQPLLSFDNSFLAENGLYDAEQDELDEARIRSITRAAVRELQQQEGLKSAVWSAAIHYNTDNIHVHVAMAEPEPSRQKKKYSYFREDGSTYEKEEYVGRFKGKSISRAKSKVVSMIVNDRETNRQLSDLTRKWAKELKQLKIEDDPELGEAFLRLCSKMPQDVPMNMWVYNSNALPSEVRKEIDKFADRYLEKYHGDGWKEFSDMLRKQDEAYAKAYGLNASSRYYDGKMKDLHSRMGNAVLQGIRNHEKAERQAKKEAAKEERRRKKEAYEARRKQWEKEREEKRRQWEADQRRIRFRRSMYELGRALDREYTDFRAQMDYERSLDEAARANTTYI